ncbi:hypothetical protein SMD22_00475 (plasmid) [Brevibacillus halotolerans]|nr:hypothetical protein SMD22_00475 [Brevibacillus halotolerans]
MSTVYTLIGALAQREKHIKKLAKEKGVRISNDLPSNVGGLILSYPDKSLVYLHSWSYAEEFLTTGKVVMSDLESDDPDATYDYFGVRLPSTKPERVEIVNKIIRKIATSGRKFFRDYDYEDGRKVFRDGVAHFILDVKERPVFVQSNGSIIKFTSKNAHERFNNGGTMWGLVNDFYDYIKSGKETNGKHGYRGLLCPHWGYPEEDMNEIRNLAYDLYYMWKRRVV